MRSDVLPAEHVFALLVNLIVISTAISSLFLLVPRFLDQSAKLSLIQAEVDTSKGQVRALEDAIRQARVSPQVTAREQANLVPMSRVSVLWGRE